ncbi:MAG: flagellar hook-associated protein FlgK [Sphingomonas sp.]|nr:flagellar hook-associated protein FlgK [Sphingomonas sp.]
MSDLLSVGATGVLAYQSALTTVSDNIANAATPGYSRRETTLKEITSVSGVASSRAQAGNGVTTTGIRRFSDELKSSAVRSSSSDLARTESSVTFLSGIETALSGNTLSTSLTDFFNSAKAIAADPTASTPRTAFIEAATTAASAFGVTGRALDAVNVTIDTTASTSVAQINGIGTALGQVNNGLARSQPGSGAQAQLLDQRDQLLEQLSALSNVSVSTDDIGRVTVRLGDASGPVFLSGDTSGTVYYARSAAGSVSFSVNRNGVTSAVNPTGGVLAGVAEGALRVAAARTDLNQIASDFTTTVNDFQAQGRDLDGNAGTPLFTIGATPTDISVAISSPRAIAAASVGGGPRDNSNLTVLQQGRLAGGFEDRLTALVATNASTLTARQQVAAAQSTIRDGAIAARDSTSGVNLDAEAVDLLRFQQAYQASSRVIQAAQDTFQTILNIR